MGPDQGLPVIGDFIDSHFNPSIVAASFFASLCGCLLTVELLHRRGTGVQNIRSWIETCACAITMGFIGIWCMHFIGNRAITLGDGAPSIQLVYSSRYTALSAFLPFIGLSVSFAVAEAPIRSKTLYLAALIVTGVFAGLSVVGMHYIANLGIWTYHLGYKPRFLAASIIIAIGDCVSVLILFYTLRRKWISSWWKRLLCAAVLAGGISAMHFTASTQCTYRLKQYNTPTAMRSRDLQIVVAGVVCVAAATIIVGVLFATRHQARQHQKRSRKIMLACAMFDESGRILVTTEGVLPAREITEKYNHRTFDEDFDTAHPVFQWIFRVSRNWSAVGDLISRMKSHLAAARGSGQAGSEYSSTPTSSASSAVYEPGTYSDYSVIFRERFCTAAAALASSMHIPLERMGVLYDTIIATGMTSDDDTKHALDMMSRTTSSGTIEKLTDAENGGLTVFSQGQTLFLVRRVSSDDIDRLAGAGYRFASVQHVGRTIAATMRIPLDALVGHISNLKHYVKNLEDLEKNGTWLGLFAMIPKANRQSFDVAVKKIDRNQLPDAQIEQHQLSSYQSNFLAKMDGMSTPQCISFLEDRRQTDTERGLDESRFARVLLQAIMTLAQQVPFQWLQNARFYARPVFATYSHGLRPTSSPTMLYAFICATDVHVSIDGFSDITRIPLSFLRARHSCHAGSSSQQLLVQEIHQEFAPLLARKIKPTSHHRKVIALALSNITSKMLSHPRSSMGPNASHPSDAPDLDTSSDTYELVNKPQEESERVITFADTENDEFRGILVNSETVIKSDSRHEYGHKSGVGGRVTITTTQPQRTFVDELVAATRRLISSKSVQ